MASISGEDCGSSNNKNKTEQERERGAPKKRELRNTAYRQILREVLDDHQRAVRRLARQLAAGRHRAAQVRLQVFVRALAFLVQQTRTLPSNKKEQ